MPWIFFHTEFHSHNRITIFRSYAYDTLRNRLPRILTVLIEYLQDEKLREELNVRVVTIILVMHHNSLIQRIFHFSGEREFRNGFRCGENCPFTGISGVGRHPRVLRRKRLASFHQLTLIFNNLLFSVVFLPQWRTRNPGIGFWARFHCPCGPSIKYVGCTQSATCTAVSAPSSKTVLRYRTLTTFVNRKPLV